MDYRGATVHVDRKLDKEFVSVCFIRESGRELRNSAQPFKLVNARAETAMN